MSSGFVNIDRQTPLLLPADVQEWVQRDHLARFIVDAVEALDMHGFKVNERATGDAQYPHRNAWMRDRGLASVPELKRGRILPKQVAPLLATSAVDAVPMEGIYLRCERDEWLQARAKVVSALFKQQIEEHWTRRPVLPNRLAMARV